MSWQKETTRVSRRAALAGGAGLGALMSLQLRSVGNTLLAPALAHDAVPLPGSGVWRPTVCAGCTTFCAKQIYVQDGRVLNIRGNEHSKTTGTSGCVRQFLSLGEVYDPDRVKTPLKRTNPEKGRDQDPGFVPIGWDEAIDMLADRLITLRQRGEPYKFMTLQGRYSRLAEILMNRVPAIIGSPNAISHSSICAEADNFGPYYMEGNWGYRQYDLENTRYQICFGTDPISVNRQVSFATKVWGQALDRGGVAVVDPRFSATAAKADEWLPIKPGTDSALALALAHVLLTEGRWHRPFVGDFTDGENRFFAGETVDEASFEDRHSHGLVSWWNLELKDRTPAWAASLTELSEAQIRRVALKLADAAPHVAVWTSRGIDMTRRGCYASMCAHALSGLLGTADNEGGTLRYNKVPRQSAPAVDAYQDEIAEAGVTMEKIDRRGRLELPALKEGKSGGGVVSNQPADSILEGDPYDIEVLLAYWSNFAFSCPNPERWERAMAKVPFVAHVTTNISEISWFADLILPAPHHMYERWGLSDSAGNGYGHMGLQTPMIEPLNGGVMDETGIPWLLGEALAKKGFTALADYLRTEFKDPETGAEPTDATEFGLFAVKRASQPLWDPAQHKSGDRFDGWQQFAEVGVWNSDKFAFRSTWGEMGTKTGTFEFYSETLKAALTAHAEKHGVTIDRVLEVCNYDARGERAFVPHWEEPYRYGSEEAYPLLFVDHKSRLAREGRSSNTIWFQANKDIDMGERKWADVAKLNPIDAERFGIRDGDRIRLTTVAGSITCEAALWEGARPGTIIKSFGQGHWAYGRNSAEVFGRTARGGNNNDLMPLDYDRLSGASVYYGQIGVRVEKAGEPA